MKKNTSSSKQAPTFPKTLTLQDLHGVWSALPVPWAEDGGLDEQVFVADVNRLCQAGVHGVYSGGTTGELYVQNFELFSAINETLIGTAHDCGTFVQAGCTALGTDEVCKRVRHACKLKADAVQIALPFWLELDDQEVMDFWSAVADAAGSVPIIHYDTGRSKRRISPLLYQRIREKVPTLWGTKFGGTDVWMLRQITLANPELKVFTGEHILASCFPLGATGTYSSLVTIKPSWMLEYYEACRSAKWDHSFRIQNEVAILFAGFDRFVTPGMQDTAIDRILGQLAGFQECPLEAKGPYRHGTEEDLRGLQEYTREKLPHLFQ